MGQTTHLWTFYYKIDGEVYEVTAKMILNPMKNHLLDLILCFSPTCFPETQSSSSSLATMPYFGTSSSFLCDCGNISLVSLSPENDVDSSSFIDFLLISSSSSSFPAAP